MLCPFIIKTNEEILPIHRFKTNPNIWGTGHSETQNHTQKKYLKTTP